MFYKGFYTDYLDLKRELEGEDITFGFMENTCDAFHQDELEILDLEKYLHGYCDEFALMLNSVYGYSIEVIFFCHKIIHAYCKVGDFYIDVRGITDDKELFFSEFTEELKKETHRVTYQNKTECFESLCDWCGLRYHIANKKELKLLSEDRWLDNYYKLTQTS
jgi:hypothetical protein